MNENLSGYEKFKALDNEYRLHIGKLKTSWLSTNQVESKRVYEVMYQHEQAEVQGKISAWSRYIKPLAEDWWKERGYGVVWPEDDSQPMKVYELETVN